MCKIISLLVLQAVIPIVFDMSLHYHHESYTKNKKVLLHALAPCHNKDTLHVIRDRLKHALSEIHVC